MKKLLYIFLMFSMLSSFMFAATRGDIKVIESSEDIRFLTQRMVKNYLQLYRTPQKTTITSSMEESLSKLSASFRSIAVTTKDSDSKDILDFLAYSKGEIEKSIKIKPDNEKALLMLEYGEIILEGVNSIENAHRYDFSEDENMLIIAKNMKYLLESIVKYYMAYHMNIAVERNEENMLVFINEFEENLQQINFYDYPHDTKKIRFKINKLWKVNKVFLFKEKQLFLPNLLNSSIVQLEDYISDIELYHSKNQ